MTYNYLWLVNRLCEKLNEVPLTSGNFASATGVYSDFQDSINAAIADIYQQEDQAWPFAWIETSFQTQIGVGKYNKDASALSVDWNTFAIEKTPITPDSITCSGTTATGTYAAGHPFQTGDNLYIKGATQSGYNGFFTVTVTSSTQWTFTVASGTVSPATGTILVYPDVVPEPLTSIDIYAYREEGYKQADDQMIMVGDYAKPKCIVRKPDNNFIITGTPDRIYTISYDYYAAPTLLSSPTDVPAIYETFKEVIVSGGIYYAYKFRDNEEQAASAGAEFEQKVNRMRRILIPQQQFMRISD